MNASDQENPRRWAHPVRARVEAGAIVTALTLTTSSVESAALAATLGLRE